LRASGCGFTPGSDKLLKKVCANLVEPRDFRLETLADGHHLPTGFEKLLEQVSPNAVETSDFLLGRCSGKREAPETERGDCACSDPKRMRCHFDRW
jgi:hypothetical protein